MKNMIIALLLSIVLKDKLLGTQLQNFIGVSITTSIIIYALEIEISKFKAYVRRAISLKIFIMELRRKSFWNSQRN